MRFACEQCQTKYSIPDERVRGKILKIRCKNCSCLISVSEGGVRTARPVDQAMAGLGEPEGGEGGDSTMIGGMADFFGKQGPPPESEDWHLSVDGNQNGPMPLADLAQRVLEQAGTSAELFVWRDGFDGWKAAETVPEIQAAVEKARGGAPKIPGSLKAPSAPSVPAALPSLESDGGDATQIGSLNFAALDGNKGDDDEVQDASLLGLEPDAIEEFAAAPSAARPAGRPAPALPPKAPPPFKAPPPTAKAPPLPGKSPAPLGAPKAAAAGAAPPPGRPAAPLFKTLPHRGLMAGPPSSPPALSEPSPPTPAPAPAPAPPPAAPVPDLAALLPPSLPAPSSPPPSVTRSSQPGPVNMPSAEPSVMSALQFAAPMTDLDSAPKTKPSAPMQPRSKLPLFAALGLVGVLVVGGGLAVLLKPGRHPAPKVESTDAHADAGATNTSPDGGTKPGADAATKPEKKGVAKKGLEGLDEGTFKDLLASGDSALSKCYGKALKKDASLSGKTVKVEVEVTGKGKASEVTLDGPESDGKLGKCMEKALKKWKFPKGEGKKPYKARFPLTIDS